MRDISDSFDYHLVQLQTPSPRDRLDEHAEAASVWSLGMGPRSIIARLRAMARLRELARSLAPEIVHLEFGTEWIDVGLPRGAPRLLQAHEGPEGDNHTVRYFAMMAVLSRAFGYQVVTPAEGVREDLERTLRIPGTQTTVINLGVDPIPANDTSGPAGSCSGSRPEIRIVTVGRLVSRKNPSLLLGLAERLADADVEAHITIVGEGPLLGRMRREVIGRGLDGRVALPGFVDDLDTVLARADIFVNPSSYEGFGLAVVEAMMARLPVIAVRNPGTEETIEHGKTGFLVPDGDLDELMSVVSQLISSPSLREEMGQTAHRMATRQFTSGHYMQDLQQAYRTLAARARGTSAVPQSRPSPATAPLVSVVIPTTGQRVSLRRAVRSVLRQTLTDLEVVVVNDDPSADVTSMLADFGDPRLRLIGSQQGRGPSAARNAGVEAAGGKFLAFLDDDDEWLPTKLTAQLAWLEQHPNHGAVTCFEYVSREEGHEVDLRAVSLDGCSPLDLLKVDRLHPPTVMLRRSAWARAGGFDEQMWEYEDLDWSLRLAAVSPIGTVPLPLVRIRVRPQDAAEVHARIAALEHMVAKSNARVWRSELLYRLAKMKLRAGDRSGWRRLTEASIRADPRNLRAAIALAAGSNLHARASRLRGLLAELARLMASA